MSSDIEIAAARLRLGLGTLRMDGCVRVNSNDLRAILDERDALLKERDALSAGANYRVGAMGFLPAESVRALALEKEREIEALRARLEAAERVAYTASAYEHGELDKLDVFDAVKQWRERHGGRDE